MEERKLTGYPSIDKPWLSSYPAKLLDRKKDSIYTINEKLKSVWSDDTDTILHYYGKDISVAEFFRVIDIVARSLVALGLKSGDVIMASLEATPEFVYLFLACEQLGLCIKNYIGDTEALAEIINRDNISYYFTHDYISSRDCENIYRSTSVKRIIIINPLYSVSEKYKVRENISKTILEHYSSPFDNSNNLLWHDFLDLAKNTVLAEKNTKSDLRLFCGYTSGTMGIPKEVIHSSKTILGVINQLALYPMHREKEDTWLHTILPPTLVAVVVAMIFFPISDGKKLILDPYCKVEDVDIEMMCYEPNGWALIPMFFEVLLDSKRIPVDYDMSYFKLFGFGAEQMSKKFVDNVQRFLDTHNCKAPFCSGYGQSEGGSDFTYAIGRDMLYSGTAGIPLIDTTISIFQVGTDIELQYNQIGEICKSGEGIMIGYSDKELTKTVLKMHSDGKRWLHTGDYGYMTEQGLLFYLGRNKIKIFPDKEVFGIDIENKVLSLKQIKDAIVVSGADKEHAGYEWIYLFIIPQQGYSDESAIEAVKNFCKQNLCTCEIPKEVFAIEKKPYHKFKTDRAFLQRKYKLMS